MVKHLLLIFLLSFTFIHGNAQKNSGSISGKITDQDGNPLSRVNIKLKGTTLGSPTGQDGLFNIKNIPYGVYTIEISGLGFEKQFKKVEVTGDVSYNYTLNEKNQDLDEVHVSGASTPKYTTEISSLASKSPIP